MTHHISTFADHVILAPADRPLDENDFLTWCARRSLIPVERTWPLGRLDIIPGLPEGRIGLLLVLHHVVADGRRGVALSPRCSTRHQRTGGRRAIAARNLFPRTRTWSATTYTEGGMRYAAFAPRGSSGPGVRCALSPAECVRGRAAVHLSWGWCGRGPARTASAARNGGARNWLARATGRVAGGGRRTPLLPRHPVG